MTTPKTIAILICCLTACSDDSLGVRYSHQSQPCGYICVKQRRILSENALVETFMDTNSTRRLASCDSQCKTALEAFLRGLNPLICHRPLTREEASRWLTSTEARYAAFDCNGPAY